MSDPLVEPGSDGGGKSLDSPKNEVSNKDGTSGLDNVSNPTKPEQVVEDPPQLPTRLSGVNVLASTQSATAAAAAPPENQETMEVTVNHPTPQPHLTLPSSSTEMEKVEKAETVGEVEVKANESGVTPSPNNITQPNRDQFVSPLLARQGEEGEGLDQGDGRVHGYIIMQRAFPLSVGIYDSERRTRPASALDVERRLPDRSREIRPASALELRAPSRGAPRGSLDRLHGMGEDEGDDEDPNDPTISPMHGKKMAIDFNATNAMDQVDFAAATRAANQENSSKMKMKSLSVSVNEEETDSDDGKGYEEHVEEAFLTTPVIPVDAIAVSRFGELILRTADDCERRLMLRLLIRTKKQKEAEVRREGKWLEMLRKWYKWTPLHAEKLRDRARKGIPMAVRAFAWPLLSQSAPMKEVNKGLYRELVSDQSDSDDVIRLDITRTFPSTTHFGSLDVKVDEKGWMEDPTVTIDDIYTDQEVDFPVTVIKKGVNDSAAIKAREKWKEEMKKAADKMKKQHEARRALAASTAPARDAKLAAAFAAAAAAAARSSSALGTTTNNHNNLHNTYNNNNANANNRTSGSGVESKSHGGAKVPGGQVPDRASASVSQLESKVGSEAKGGEVKEQPLEPGKVRAKGRWRQYRQSLFNLLRAYTNHDKTCTFVCNYYTYIDLPPPF